MFLFVLVKMDYNYNYLIITQIHVSPEPFSIRILLTRYYITFTNQVCQIGIIRINIYPISSLLDQGLDQYDSLMISQDWSYNRKKFYARILYDPIHIGEYKNANKKEEIKSGFHENSQYLDWVEMLGLMIPPPEPPP